MTTIDWSTIFGTLAWQDDLIDLNDGCAFIRDAEERHVLSVHGTTGRLATTGPDALTRDQYVAIAILVARAPQMLAALTEVDHPLGASVRERIEEALQVAHSPESDTK